MNKKSIGISQKLSIKSNEKWFEQLPKIPYKKEIQSEDTVLALNAEAENFIESETRLYNQIKEGRRDKDFLWVKRIFHSGTLSDKVSAYTLLIQECPVYNVHYIEILINMVNIKGKRECLMSMDALQELFNNYLLADDRKLKHFNEEPLKELNVLSNNDPTVRKRLLILWIFESKIKSLYEKFVKNLVSVSHDTIEKTKQKAITVMFNLLKENPEQEQLLLEHIINKIGDPVPKLGSHACYLLGQLLIQHPDMKGVVIQEVERFVFRSNLQDRARYYALCFMNQIIFSQDDYQHANRLINIYFGQFKMFVNKGEVDTKMMSALLTGVSRAYPYSKLKQNVIMEQLDAMYHLVHVVSFNVSVQALMLIFQVLDSKDSVSDRFYCALYRKLLDPALRCSSKQASLLNLVYRALKKDVTTVRVKAFIKRLLQISLYQAPNLQCGILIVLSALSKTHPNVLETKPMFASDSDSEEHYEDVPDAEDEQRGEKTLDVVPVPTTSSWVHRRSVKKHKSKYDFHSRNPLYAGAEFSNAWELLFLKQSFHPSVSLFAHQFGDSKEIKYSGDPLLDFTVTRFLDRFVYRNPKKLSANFEQNVHTRVFGSRKLKFKMSKLASVNRKDYLQQRAQNVPVEEKYIYDYLKKSAVSKKNQKDDSDIESVTSEDFQTLLNNVIPEDEGKDSLDFAKELGLHKQKKGLKRKGTSDSEDGSDESLLNESDLEDFENEEGLNSVDEDLCEEDLVASGCNSGNKSSKKKKKQKSFNSANLLASAEEFATLLEEDNANSRIDTITEGALANKDNAGPKQIAWEINRHRYVKGLDWKNKKKNFKKFRKSKR